jgi:nucleoside-diphosphate-sugar epimerase
MRAITVTGATGIVGSYLLPLLLERGFRVQAVSRRPPPPTCDQGAAAGSLTWLGLDIGGGRTAGLGPATALVHAAPLWLLPPLLPAVADLGVHRLIAFGSTSRFTKEASSSPTEREAARRLAEAERAVSTLCAESGIAETLFRPTLIYGGGRDRNVGDIARFVRRFGFFPVAGQGLGRRQPVHAEDLARACLAALDNRATFGRSYDVPGGETITYREMVARIARSVGRAPRILPVPLPLLRLLLAWAGRVPGLGHLTPEMADRMSEDLTFDGSAARVDFGYAPRSFDPPQEPSITRAT